MKRVALIALLLVATSATVNASTTTGAANDNLCTADIYESDKDVFALNTFSVESVGIVENALYVSCDSYLFVSTKAVEAVCVNRYLHNGPAPITLVNDVGKQCGLCERIKTGPTIFQVFRRARDGFVNSINTI